MSVPMTSEVIPAPLWLPLQEQLLRGLNHSLSNRVASVGAVGALIDDPDPGLSLGTMLTEDASRLSELLELYRGLVAADAASPQACMIEPLVVRALAYASHHGGLRSHQFRSEIASPAPSPVLIFPGTLLRLLLLSLAGVAGGLAKDQGASAMVIGVREEEGAVRVEVRAEAVAPASAVTASAFQPFAAAVARLRGEAREMRTSDSHGWVFCLPVLGA